MTVEGNQGLVDRDSDDLQSAGSVLVAWTTSAANKDIRALDPTGAKRCCRAIVVGGNGTLVMTGLDGTNVTLPDMGQAWQWDVQAANLVASGSTATYVVLYW